MAAHDGRVRTFAVTALDTWQRWLEDEGDDDTPPQTVEDLRARLMGRDQSEQMLAGAAGHKVLELLALEGSEALEQLGTHAFANSWGDLLRGVDPTTLAAGAYTRVPVTLNDKTTREISLRWELPNLEELVVPPLAEAKVERVYETSLGPVTAKGRIDGGDGIVITDYKFSGRAAQATFFEDLGRSWQWRIYLEATGARRINYEVFTVKKPLQDAPDVWRIGDRQTYSQWAYPGMGDDVRRVVERFACAIDEHVPEYWDRVALREAALEEGD